MSTLSDRLAAGRNRFQMVAGPFLQQKGLPFSQMLSAEAIERAFAEHGALFAQDAIFSTPVVLWAFLSQALRDGKGAACAAAVADIVAYGHQTGGPVPSGDTGDYCRARAKLAPEALRALVGESARQLEAAAPKAWLWHDRHTKLIDGFTFTMPDTRANQRVFPQQETQTPGVGFPIARCCAVVSLATGAIHDVAIGPYQGKETGETALLRSILACLEEGDVAVLDRYFCSYWMLAILVGIGVDVCTRLHQLREADFRRGRRLGDYDHVVTWRRPERPEWMSPEQYAGMPATLTLRELEFDVTEPDRRTERITVVTTLTDPEAYPKEEIAALFGYRWNVELDIRVIKQTLHLDHVRCKRPAMVRRELWVTLLAYNLIRKVAATAAALHDKQPRQMSFTFTCQRILSSWTLLATGAIRDPEGYWAITLKQIAAHEVADRPGRIEPRVLKRRRHRYPLMRRPRAALRRELSKT